MSTEVLFVTILMSITGLLLVGAFVWFFADDRNRVEAKQIKQKALEHSFRTPLGEFADIDEAHMTSDVEARMTEAQKEQWKEYQLAKGQYAFEQKFSLDLFGPTSWSNKLKRLAKMLGICLLIGIGWAIFSVIDDGLGLKAHRGVPASVAVIIAFYLLFIFVRSRVRGHHTSKQGGQHI